MKYPQGGYQAEALARARAMASALHAAQTLAALDALYLEWIGYSILADDPDVQLPEVADILAGYLREYCASNDVAYIDALKD